MNNIPVLELDKKKLPAYKPASKQQQNAIFDLYNTRVAKLQAMQERFLKDLAALNKQNAESNSQSKT